MVGIAAKLRGGALGLDTKRLGYLQQITNDPLGFFAGLGVHDRSLNFVAVLPERRGGDRVAGSFSGGAVMLVDEVNEAMACNSHAASITR